MQRYPTALVVMTLLLAVVLGGGSAPPGGTPAYADAEPGTRVMIMGDSMTHGSAGDWTWRYFLWKHLERVGSSSSIDLVGPADDVWEGSQDYVDPFFDRDHAARWGNRLDFAMYDPAVLARQHAPDVVVVLLGFNDLVFLQQSPAEVEQSMRDTIAVLRGSAPGVDVVLARIPIVTRAGVPETNQRYSALAAELDTANERVVVAHADAGFDPGDPGRVEDTWDSVHPTSRGYLKIAAAVADALATLGVGAPYPRPLPQLPLGPRTGAVLEADAADEAAHLRWTSAPGTTGEVVWSRDTTLAGSWVRNSDVVAGASATVGGLRNGHTYEVAVKPAKGWAVADDTWSNVVLVTPRAAAPGTPRGLSGQPRRHGALLDWRDVPAATSYVASYRLAGSGEGWRTKEVVESVARLRRLLAGGTYVVKVHAVDDGTAGSSSGRVLVRPTGPRPAAPVITRAAVRQGNIARLRWEEVRRATHYQVQLRNVSADGRWRPVDSAPTTGTSFIVPALREDTAYAFRVTSWHQLVRGGTSDSATVRTSTG